MALLYDRALFLDAYALLTELGAPEELPVGRESVVGARLVHHLGAPKRARRLFLSAYRRNPRDPWARVAVEYIRGELRGSWAILESLNARPLDGDGEHLVIPRGDALELEVLTNIEYRDFAAAEAGFARWAQLEGEANPDWLYARAHWLERMDRLEESLELARRARLAHPQHRRLLLYTGQLLALSGRPDEALALFTGALDTMQSSDVAQMTYMVAMALEAHSEAVRAARRWAELSPLAEPDVAAAIQRRLEEAQSRLDGSGEVRAQKCRLDVPFVRQHHLTCAPATLSALCTFFDRPAEHVEVADRICYAGTPAHAERAWAEEHAFVAREFTLTWETACALLDRGLPFQVSTFVPGSGHAQAVMGYDAGARTLVLRDPTIPLPLHVDAPSFLERFRHSGPRAMVLVPSEQANRLEGIALPDAALYDELHVLERALSKQDREAAHASCARMRDAAPGHRLTRAARRAIANYDGNVAELLGMAKEAFALDPTNDLARFDVVSTSGTFEARTERIVHLTEAARDCGTSYAFQLRLAVELAADSREHGRARRALREVLAQHAESADALDLLGQMAWTEGQTARALHRFRLAACVAPTDDARVRNYVMATQRAGRAHEALPMLRERVARFGLRSTEPAVLLAELLEYGQEPSEALRVLEAAEKSRPDDGEAALAAARHHAKLGRRQEARAALERAHGKTDRISWLRSAALTSASLGTPAEKQVALWEELAQLAPLDVQAHITLTTLLQRTRGREAAIEHLRAHLARFPHHVPTAHLLLEWVRDTDPERRESAIRKRLATEPNDAWAHRELALALAERQRWDEARAAIEKGASLEPRSLSLELTRALLEDKMGRHDEARAAYRAGLDIDADAPAAISRLVLLTPVEEREALLRELFQVAAAGAIASQTFSVLYEMARLNLAHGTLAELLDGLRERRSDVAVVWGLSVRHTLAVSPSKAGELAEEALSRFPHVDAIHLDAARVWEGDRKLAALERAVELGPQNATAVLRLSEALEARGDRERLDAVLAQACHRSSFDPTVVLHAARVKARRGEVTEAVDELARVLARDPECEVAWDAVQEFASFSAEEGMRVREMVQRLAFEHPYNAHAQTAHAAFLAFNGAPDDACAVLEAARERIPGTFSLRDEAARILALVGRTDDALRMCSPLKDEARLPASLRARAAWVRLVAGDKIRGINELRNVLREEPSLTGAWRWLIDARLELRAHRNALVSARKLAAIAPFEPGVQARLGRALLGMGKREEAKAAMRRALGADPTDMRMALTLFHIGVEDGDRDAASFALDLLRVRVPEERLLNCEVRAAIARGDDADAVARFRSACRDPRARPNFVAAAYSTLLAMGLGPDANRALEEAVLSGGDVNAATGRLWVRTQARRHGLAVAERMTSLPASSGAGRSTAMAFCDLLAEYSQRDVLAQLRAHGEWLRADDVGWSAAFTPLLAHRRFVRALLWSRGWRDRRQASPEHLHDLALALRALGFRGNAIAVSRAALRRDDCEPRALTGHRAWLAFEEAVAKRPSEANSLLAAIDDAVEEGVDDSAYPAISRQVAHLARALVDVQTGSASDRSKKITLAREAIQSLTGNPRTRTFVSGVARRARFHLVWYGQFGALFDGHVPSIRSLKKGWIPIVIVLLTAIRLSNDDNKFRLVAIALLGPIMALVVLFLAVRAMFARH
ncbi:C39 family peptidase [Pendulispora brunnea]|uniref:C39 family peptidase n=1 Tax=Pendulispora brunnea TaxID=2905690 RepID=A0ABZ2K2R1_9BACT